MLWSEALGRHRAAAAGFRDTAGRIEPAAWTAPPAPGKWSPAEITEHLSLAYEVVGAQIRGGTGLRLRSGWLMRQVVRALVLPSILRRRALPRGVRAPSEIRPRTVRGSQAEALELFGKLANGFEDEIFARRHQPGLTLNHHVFGGLDLLRGVDFIAIHVEHHHRQIQAP